MRDEMLRRLEELRAEFEVGQNMLAELEARQANLKSSLLRIGGAIQVLEELLGREDAPGEFAPATQRQGAAAGG